MKKSYFWMITAASALLFGLTSCSSDDPEPGPEPKPGEGPSVTLTAGPVTDVSIKFTVSPANADKCLYQVIAADAPAPTVPIFLGSGIEVPADKPTEVPVPDLTPNTAYAVYAVAFNGEQESEIKKLVLTTSQTVEPTKTVELEWPLLAYYYSEKVVENTGNFYFNLVRRRRA